MKLSIIGTGKVGQVLALRFLENGHEVIIGTRNPDSDKVSEIIKAGGDKLTAQKIEDAIYASDIIVLAVPFLVAKSICQSNDLKDKIIIDCTNPLKPDLSGLIETKTSAGEQIAKWSQSEKVIKAFNMVGTAVMTNPTFAQDKALLAICGDDQGGKGIARQLAEECGFEVIDAGALSMAKYLEYMAMLWIHLAFHQGMGSDFAFKLLKR